MGTSSRYPGPRGGDWAKARGALTALGKRLDRGALDGPQRAEDLLADSDAQRIADMLYDALLGFPDRQRLVVPLAQQAHALVTTLDRLHTHGLQDLAGDPAGAAADREYRFVAAFLDQRSVKGDTVPESAVRQGARDCAEHALADPRLSSALQTGDRSYRISGELFCSIFGLFFADAVRNFLQCIVAEHLKVAMPVLYLDPTGAIANAVSDKIIGLVPNPCEEQTDSAGEPATLTEVARSLISSAISSALGLDG